MGLPHRLQQAPSLLFGDHYIESAVDEDFIVKCVSLAVLITVLSWIYQCVSYFYIIRLRESLAAVILPAYEARDTFARFGELVSHSIMDKMLTVLNTEIARKKILPRANTEEKQRTLDPNGTTETKSHTDGEFPNNVLAKSRRNESLYMNYEDSQDACLAAKSSGSLKTEVTFQPAFIIPVPSHRKLKFNDQLLKTIKK